MIKPIKNLNDIKKVKRIAYAIQKSLNRKGIQRTGFLTDLVKEQFNQLSNIDVPVVQDIAEDIDNILERNGYKKAGDKFSISIIYFLLFFDKNLRLIFLM